MVEQYPLLQGADSFFFKGNQIGILISHGFVGTPQSVRFLGEYLASKGYTVYGVRLKGHGTHYEDMERCSYQDWIQSLEDSYSFLQQQCREIFIIGQSMGGTLTLNLAYKFKNIKGIMLINAAINSIPPMEGYKNKQILRFVPEGAPDIKAKNIHEITYTKAPVRSIRQLFALMEQTRDKLPAITCPVLAFKSEEDHVVTPDNTDFIMSKIQSGIKKVVPLYNSFHVASMDNDKELIGEQCSLFINKLANSVYNTSSIKEPRH
ncbi:carboxylesterase [Bacillus sp. OK048]|uniref:alpha/beta hydrolase n=1 Tax=Bacillus sp. OK048 TaxID=1882761 RepID=UPI00088B443A|nr:alpha/beta fold hydrolase [Bacillus sp. OK048]SDM42972.1 carboxylesterase [Bacillus sp. OK048]